VFQEHPARARQSGGAGGALEQPHTQVLFQLLDRARQRRLLNMQSFCRSGEVKFFGNGNKAA
jgi:hypothetical protein